MALLSAYVRLPTDAEPVQTMAMPAPVPAKEWTLEMLHALPDDGKRYELVDGELLVSPSPSREHQRVAGAFYLLLAPWAREHGLDVYYAPAAVQFSDQRELQPDLFAEPLAERHRPRDRTRPVLAIEVLSPSTARYDRVTKRHVYMEEGVNEYWIVDPEGRTVERWTQGEERPEVLERVLSWTPPGGPTLDVDLVALFAQALD
jgi:Uma2 family endonuclease